jgi:hypothetical protein
MARLLTRIKRLEVETRNLPAWRLPELDDPAFETLAKHPEGPALLRELASIIRRVIEERRPVDMAEFRQGIIGYARGGEILCCLSEIQSGIR